MADHLEDDEQVEALKRWWDENGKSTMAGVVLAVAGTVGWQQYQGWSVQQGEMASDAWGSIEAAVQSGDSRSIEDINALAESLKDDFSGTVYARFAALQLAALAVEAGDLDVAESELRWALTKEGENSELGQLIQLRLARVLADQGDTSSALAILNSNTNAYPAAYAVAKGDIFVSEGRHAEALSAYREARAVLLALGNPPGILETKITSLESRLASSEEAS
jgi:predicted negative regulator of RcsB-dependent stress response